MPTAAVRRVHSGVVAVGTACRRRIRHLESRLGGLSDCVGEGLQIVAAWFQRVRIRRDAHDLPAPGSRQTIAVHLTQVVAVRFGVGSKRPDDCCGVGIHVGESGDRGLSAGRLGAAATTHVRHASGQILITGVAAPPSGESPCVLRILERWLQRPTTATSGTTCGTGTRTRNGFHG